ncbi:2Fe-2S iron-sulfur cluster-binding protein [Bradyrhizobium sp. USDA 4502]
MPKIVYVAHSGETFDIEVSEGLSVMEGAVGNSVPGIDGDCGGQVACGTCHVMVDAVDAERAGSPDNREREMLAMIDSAGPYSRLACQIEVNASLDGLVIRLPENQF